jgi:large subunit ribosomal protein L25
MDRVQLYTQPRTVVGKRVKQLRREGIIPLVLYGETTDSTNIQASEFDTRRAVAEASGQLIALHIEGEGEPRMTLAREVQRDSISGSLLHVDFYEVDVTERIEVEVPLSIVGEREPELVQAGEATVLNTLNLVEIECLPTDILQMIEVDVSGLADWDDAIYVRDLVVPESVTLLTDPEEMVARLEPVIEEEEEEEELEMPEIGEVEVIQRAREEEEELEGMDEEE